MRYLIILVIFTILGLFFNIVEGHANPEEDGYCGMPPVEAAQIDCHPEGMEGNPHSDYAVAAGPDEVCWCMCLEQYPTCLCQYPMDMSDTEWLFYLITQGRPTEIRI